MTTTTILTSEEVIGAGELTADEQRLVSQLRTDVQTFAKKNARRHALYEGEFVADQIGIAVPPFLRDWPVRIGWGTTVVDVIAERMNWQGFTSTDGEGALLGLDELSDRVFLSAKIDQAVLASLTVGTGFMLVLNKGQIGRAGGEGEAGDGAYTYEVGVAPKSPSQIAVVEDPVTGELTAALVQVRDRQGVLVAETLYRPTERVVIEHEMGRVARVVREANPFGEVPVVPMPNQPTDMHPRGRSLLTPPIQYLISTAARTMLGMEVHREFYSAPQRAALGATSDMFGLDDGMSAEEKIAAGWALAMGRLNIVPPNGEGEIPKMMEYPASPPSGYIEILRHLSLMVCADAGLPPSYLGVHADNPASADSIKALEARIERTTLARIRDHDRALRAVARLALKARDGRVDERALAKIKSRWASPTTPTPSAAADAGMKLVSAQILPPDSTVTYGRIGLSEDEQKTLIHEKRQARLADLTSRLTASRVSGEAQSLAARRGGDEQPAGTSEADAAATLKAKFDALGVAVRAGVDPEDAAARLGLSGIKFTGAMPVSLRVPESQAEHLEER